MIRMSYKCVYRVYRVYIRIYIYIYRYVCIYTQIHTCMNHACTHTHIYIYIYVCMYVYIHTYIHTAISFMYTYMYIYIGMYPSLCPRSLHLPQRFRTPASAPSEIAALIPATSPAWDWTPSTSRRRDKIRRLGACRASSQAQCKPRTSRDAASRMPCDCGR